MPEMFEKSKLLYWRLFIPMTIKKCYKIGTVSKFSKSEIKIKFPDVDKKIFVTVEGVRQSLTKNCYKTNKEKFILSVLSFGRHKNLNRLVDAIFLLKNTHPNIKCKLVGDVRTEFDKHAKEELMNKIEKLDLIDNIDFLGYVTDELLAELYASCDLYVFPSLYEGFGLPIIEAQYNNAPVVCSNVASLPEIGGNACIYFDPYSPKDIANKITEVLNSQEKKSKLINLGRQNIKNYTWRKAAKQLIFNITT